MRGLNIIKRELMLLEYKVQAHEVSRPRNVLVDLIIKIGDTTIRNGGWSVDDTDHFYLTPYNINKYLQVDNVNWKVLGGYKTKTLFEKSKVHIHSSRLILDNNPEADGTLPHVKYREIVKAEVIISVEGSNLEKEDIKVDLLRSKGYLGVNEWKREASKRLGNTHLDSRLKALIEGKIKLTDMIDDREVK